eukprot:3444730-Pyramimonas_sp.AAC.1
MGLQGLREVGLWDARGRELPVHHPHGGEADAHCASVLAVDVVVGVAVPLLYPVLEVVREGP